MTRLLHHPFCPFSRAIRISFGEYGIGAEFIEERTWERRPEFLSINPAGALPVLMEGDDPPVVGIRAILEFLDETRGTSLGARRLLPDDPHGRAEVRRLLDWFDLKFDSEVTRYLVGEKILRRFMPPEHGGGPPDNKLIQAGNANIRHHLRYIDFLIARRNWLAGSRMSYADIAAAAHLSAIDYLGDVPWKGFEQAAAWFGKMKSRPAFRPLLVDRVPGMPPSPTYVDLDF